MFLKCVIVAVLSKYVSTPRMCTNVQHCKSTGVTHPWTIVMDVYQPIQTCSGGRSQIHAVISISW